MDNNILVIIAFCVLTAASSYMILNRILLSDERRRNVELLKSSKSITVTVRLQAYERLILFLERISPEVLLLKLKNQAQTNSDLHLAILKQIRFEYEHNLSQQLYVSNDTWALVKETKEKIAMLVNDLAKETNPVYSSIELANRIINKLAEEGNPLISEAIKKIKDEAHAIM
ncbi:MAG: hypothetical protein LBG92_06930 [Prevotellaceae bacterium]|jgi:hypothetical protein|nr:hypothetical protein [Prevotellaceae bacterium]